jgi:hypothetical protein
LSRVHVRTLQINGRGKAWQNVHTTRNSVQNCVLHVKLLAEVYEGKSGGLGVDGRTGYDVRGLGMGCTDFQKKCGTHLKTVGVRRLICSSFRTELPRAADATATCSRLGFVRTWFNCLWILSSAKLL